MIESRAIVALPHDDSARPWDYGSGSWRLLITIGVAMLFLGPLTVIALYRSQGNDPRVPRSGNRETASLVVQNKVVIGPSGLVEDVSPAYLSDRPVARCTERNCKIPGTNMWTGRELVAVCFTFGELMTNMDLHSAGARRNPERVSSDLWYGVRLPDDSLAYLSEVYVALASRNGLGLQLCETLAGPR